MQAGDSEVSYEAYKQGLFCKFNNNSSEMLRVCVCFYLKHGAQAKDRDTENTASAVFMYRCVLLDSAV